MDEQQYIKKNMNLALNEYPYPTYVVLFLSTVTSSSNVIGIQHYPKYAAGDW